MMPHSLSPIRRARPFATRLLGLGLALVSVAGAHATNGVAQGQAPALDEAWRLAATVSSLDDVVVPGAFRGPNGVDVAPDGRIYVADERAGAVHVLSPLGLPEGLWDGGGALAEPRDVAVAADRIYVTEPTKGRVEMLDLTGASLGGFEVAGRPSGIAWRAGKLFLTTIGSGEIVALTPEGVELRRWGGDDIEQPGGIDIGGDGLIYVTDLVVGNGGGFVRIYDEEGVLLGLLPTMVDGSPQPALDLAVEDRAQQPEVYLVTELHLVRIHPVDGIRSAIRSPGGRGVAVGPGQGLVFAAQDFRQGFTGLRRIGDRRERTPEIEGWGGPFAPLGVLDAPRRVSVATDGQAFVLDQWPRVQVWGPDDVPRGQFGSGGIQDLAAGLPGSIYGIEGHTLTFWADDGQALWTWQPPSTRPDTGVAWGWLTHADGDGSDVLALDTGDQRVFVRDFSGNPLGEWPVSPPDGFTSIGDIALTRDTVWLLDRGALALRRHERESGVELGRIDVPRGARRIDARDDGRAFVLLDEGWVFVFEVDGRVSAAWQVDEPRGATDLAVAGDALLVAHTDDRLTRWTPDPDAPPGELPVLELRCNLLRDKTATPPEVALGDRVRVGLSIDGDCPLADAEADILLLVDTSGSMSGPKMSAARSAVLEFVGQLDYSLHQVGLITFSTDVDLVQGLTSNPRSLLRAIPLLGDDAGTNMTDAMMLADRELRSRRAREEARQVVVILSDGRPNGDPSILLNMASNFRSQGREIYTIGLGADVDSGFMRRMADDQAHYFEAPTEYDLSRIYETIGRRASASALLREAVIVDEIPANMAFVPDTDVPRATYDPAARTLTWRVTDVPPGGLRLRYRLRPMQAGTHPTNVRAVTDYVDGVRFAGQLVFPVPEVTVLQPERYSAYLPLTYKQKCPEARIDVALVLDTSASMRTIQPGGGTKLESAQRAATVFLGLLRLGGGSASDRVAVAAFHGEATVVQGLTGDRAALLGALASLPAGSGTRIDRGLAAGLDALASRRPEAVPALVLLTDGNQAEEGSAALLEAARQARQSGILIYTIGLGPDADRGLLEAVSGSADRTFMAPSDEELADIYRAIAAAIPCG